MKGVPGLVALLACMPLLKAQQHDAAPNLRGVYESIPDRLTLAGGLKNTGSPESVELLPGALRQARSTDLKKDPWKMCQPVGPFRMMAREHTRIELAQVDAMLVMLFEDLSHGMTRTIYLKRGHRAPQEPTWLGDSVGRWESETLVVDTTAFNDQTWLNDNGAPHSDTLHLVERIRPVLRGDYLEYKMTAEDAKALARPYSFTRYFKKIDTELADDVCQDEE